MGLSDALVELLVQAPLPSICSLLPGLSSSRLAAGHVYGLYMRGGYRLSMQWSQHALRFAHFTFPSKHHPYLAKIREHQPGHSRTGRALDRVEMTITASQRLHVVSLDDVTTGCKVELEHVPATDSWGISDVTSAYAHQLRIEYSTSGSACEVYLCLEHHKAEQCRGRIRSYLHVVQSLIIDV
jgi:hypothetical protein